jgi:hypothetical protein
LITVSGSSQQDTKATARVAAPRIPTIEGIDTPPARSPTRMATIATLTAALTTLLAAMVRDRSPAGLWVCRMA